VLVGVGPTADRALTERAALVLVPHPARGHGAVCHGVERLFEWRAIRQDGAVTGGSFALVLATFLASAVEAVEALTIVLAVGVTRGWRSALLGVGAALAALAAVVVLVGPRLVHVPITTLRLVVGALLLAFGLQWLRKAILRAGGLKDLHDEVAAFAREAAAARDAAPADPGAFDGYAFALSFKGVLLEGLEVVFIVLTFGAAQGRIALAALGAAAALVLVVVVGIVLRAPLARVPENSLKLVVGVLITTFGLFWSVEGLGIDWPGGDAAIPVIVAGLALYSLGAVLVLRRRVGTDAAEVTR
jgi:uncharacterized membrane protein